MLTHIDERAVALTDQSDLVLLDVHSTERDDCDVCRRLKMTPETSWIAEVALADAELAAPLPSTVKPLGAVELLDRMYNLSDADG